MSLWRRAPREVYRVYGEDRYLEGDAVSSPDASVGYGVSADGTAYEVDPEYDAGTGGDVGADPSWLGPSGDRGVAPAGSDASHGGRLVGLGLLVGVILATLVLVLVNASRSHRAAREGASGQVAQRARVGSYPGSAPFRVSASGRQRQGPLSSGSTRRSGGMPAQYDAATRRERQAPSVERAWSAAREAPGRVAFSASAVVPPGSAADPAIVALPAVSPAPAAPPKAPAPSVEDEFGFEQ